MCSGLNLPFGSHHSAAIASNLAISAASIVLAAAGRGVVCVALMGPNLRLFRLGGRYIVRA
jgi:hypothetical protein